MKPDWFKDTIPLDTLIAPMVLFFRNNGIETFNSCQGGPGHLCGRPTITFLASSSDKIVNIAALLRKNNLDTGLEIGLTTGFFADKYPTPWYGKASWLWATDGNHHIQIFKDTVYNRVVRLVDMKEVESITRDHNEWVRAGYPHIG